MQERIIKFRAWDKQNKLMLSLADTHGNGIYLSFDGKVKRFIQGMDIDQDMWADSFVIMQYTGLKDKSGKEIYEGDILEHKEAKVKFKMCWNTKDWGWTMTFMDGWNPKLPSDFSKVEVIGNIYESPELLR